MKKKKFTAGMKVGETRCRKQKLKNGVVVKTCIKRRAKTGNRQFVFKSKRI